MNPNNWNLGGPIGAIGWLIVIVVIVVVLFKYILPIIAGH